MAALQRVVVVGASLAGLCTAETLRRSGFDGEVHLVGAEVHAPYDRPPLSKQLLSGKWESSRTALRDGEFLAGLDVDMHLGQPAVRLDPERRAVVLRDGAEIPYDAAVVATGAAARRLPHQPHLDGLYTLRTLEDAMAIRHELDRRPDVAVVGGGFVGAEVAAEARRRGLAVTLIEALATPMSRGLGERMGEICARLHARNGVRLRCGVSVVGFEGSERVEGVRLDDGTVVDAQLVVVGVGARPAVEWLETSGAELGNGVVCDEFCRTSLEDVYAAGDVARWYHPVFGQHMRLEHWTNAREQARIVAANLLSSHSPKAYEPVPYVWSDQYDTRIQIAGRTSGEEVRVAHGGDGDHSLVALYRRGNLLEGALAINASRQLLQYRQLLARRGRWQEAVEGDGLLSV